MTAPTGDDALREALIEELYLDPAVSLTAEERRTVADALLPVVLRYGRDKVAEELRAAAQELEQLNYGWPSRAGGQLHARAEALTDDDPRLGFPTTGRPWT